MATIIDVLFFAVPPTMKPMKSSTFPPMMNQRRPKRSELAPQILCQCQYVNDKAESNSQKLHERKSNCSGITLSECRYTAEVEGGLPVMV